MSKVFKEIPAFIVDERKFPTKVRSLQNYFRKMGIQLKIQHKARSLYAISAEPGNEFNNLKKWMEENAPDIENANWTFAE